MRARRRNNTMGLTLKHSLLVMLFAACALICYACKDSAPQPEPPSARARSKKEEPKSAPSDADKKDKKDEAAVASDYTYNPSGKVDPFVPLITSAPGGDAAAQVKKDKKDVPLSPLQKLNVDDFSLRAVVVTDKDIKALLEDPALNGFIVQEGFLIGKNEGIIKKILPNSIIIEEYETDSQGNREKKIKTLTLKKKQ